MSDIKSIEFRGSALDDLRARAFRVIYIARLADAVYVLHCFQKKTEKTSQPDLDLATRRFRELMQKAKP